MKTTLLATAALIVLSTGCARTGAPSGAKGAASPTHARTSAQAQSDASDARATLLALPAESVTLAQKPGDFIVYRFSGSFRKKALTLTERVVDVKGALATVDLTLDDGAKKRTLRVRFDHAPGAKHEVVSVARLEGGVEKPATVDAYDAMMADTVLAADENESTLGTESVTLAVGGKNLECTKTSYRVLVGKKRATMSAVTSDGFAWGDVGGEIKSDDGKVMYKAEVIDAGNDARAGKYADAD